MNSMPLILNPVPETDWDALNTEAKGIAYAIKASGFQDKTVALETGIDPATLSKAKAGQARLSEDDLDRLMDFTRCEAPLYARMLRRQYDPRCLRKLKTELERERDEARAEVTRLKAEREIELRLMRELRTT